MIIEKEYEVRWNSSNKKHYTSKGYIFTKMKEPFFVKVNDLAKSSLTEVDYQCDYCKGFGKKKYKDLIDGRKIIEKDACGKCRWEKIKESNYKKYGKMPQQLDVIKDKTRKTIQERYGVDAYTQTEDFKEKSKVTINERYGVDFYQQTEEYKEKFKKAHLERYGVEHTFQNEEFLKKREETYLRKYGVDNPMKDRNVVNKLLTILHESGRFQCSRQQKYIHNIIGGELNFPVDNLALDIAFPDEKIYIEYNGSGHDLQVKLNSISERDFNEKEKRRFYYLKRLGWKLIEINSRKDYVPNKVVVENMVKEAKEILNKNDNSYVRFDIDNSYVFYNNEYEYYDFKELKKIYNDEEAII